MKPKEDRQAAVSSSMGRRSENAENFDPNMKAQDRSKKPRPQDGSLHADVTFEPGRLGIQFDCRSGMITEVLPGCQAAKLGVVAGWVLMKVNGIPFSERIHTVEGKITAVAARWIGTFDTEGYKRQFQQLPTPPQQTQESHVQQQMPQQQASASLPPQPPWAALAPRGISLNGMPVGTMPFSAGTSCAIRQQSVPRSASVMRMRSASPAPGAHVSGHHAFTMPVSRAQSCSRAQSPSGSYAPPPLPHHPSNATPRGIVTTGHATPRCASPMVRTWSGTNLHSVIHGCDSVPMPIPGIGPSNSFGKQNQQQEQHQAQPQRQAHPVAQPQRHTMSSGGVPVAMARPTSTGSSHAPVAIPVSVMAAPVSRQSSLH